MTGALTMEHVVFGGALIGVAVFLFLQIGSLHSRITRVKEEAKADTAELRREFDAYKLEVAKNYPSSELIKTLNGSIRDLTGAIRSNGNGHTRRTKP